MNYEVVDVCMCMCVCVCVCVWHKDGHGWLTDESDEYLECVVN